MLLQEEQYIIHWLTEYGAAAPDGGEDHPGAEA